MDKPAPPAASKRAVLFIAAASNFLVPFMGTSINVALPTIGRDLGLTAVVLGWVPMAYSLATAILLVPLGRIADMYGRKKIFIAGTITYALACLLLPFSQSGAMMLAFLALEGAGSAGIFGTSSAILMSVYPPGERGKAIGIAAAAVYLGASLGPPLGGFLTGYLTWRSIFLINVVLGIIILIIVFRKIKGEWIESAGKKLDVTGSLIYGGSLAVLIYGFSMLRSGTGIILAVIGVIGLYVFFRWEMRVKSPVIDMRILRDNPIFARSTLAAFCVYCSHASVGFLLSLYLQYVRGFPPEMTGLVLISQHVVMTILSPIAGRLSDRLEPRVVASIGMGCSTVALTLFTFLNDGSSIIYLIPVLMLLGVGFALFSSPNTNATLSSIDKKYYGVASGMTGTARLVGQMFSLAITTLLMSLFVGHVQITGDNSGLFLQSMRTTFIISAVICFGGMFASLARGNLRRE